MSRALVSIEVWRDSPEGAQIEVFQGVRRLDRVEVIPGDCLDLEVEGDMRIQVGRPQRHVERDAAE